MQIVSLVVILHNWVGDNWVYQFPTTVTDFNFLESIRVTDTDLPDYCENLGVLVGFRKSLLLIPTTFSGIHWNHCGHRRRYRCPL